MLKQHFMRFRKIGNSSKRTPKLLETCDGTEYLNKDLPRVLRQY